MVKRTLSALLSAVLAFSLLLTGASAAEAPAWSVQSATWQDPNNVMLIWEAEDGYTYNIYRAASAGGEYELIGTAEGGSFRDAEAEWPTAMYYTVEGVAADGTAGARSEPIRAGANGQKLSKVSVVMYHNFITEADEAQGVEFEEYSLRPADFAADLAWLRENGYTTITSDDVIDYINGLKPLPPKAVIISIDDGTEGVYKNGWPLLREYRAKADFNLIGENIDSAWELVHGGGTRVGQSAPYCVWEELMEMERSGEINLCSHTYGLHRFNNDGRTGASMKEGETAEEYAAVVKADYDLCVSCIGGWTGAAPTTMAYPYSRRSSESDALLLANTDYQILMGGANARGTAANYFVDGADAASQLRIMSRPCRMEGTPISEYLAAADAEDAANGVNAAEDTRSLTAEECAEIARWYSPYDDVGGTRWFAGAVYYAYVNGLLRGTSNRTFSPDDMLSRGMVATLMHRMAGEPQAGTAGLSDVESGAWYAEAAAWCVSEGVMSAEDGEFLPDLPATREELLLALYKVTEILGGDTSASGEGAYPDMDAVDPEAVEAVLWADGLGIVQGDTKGRLVPKDMLTRAQLATILMRYWQLYSE